MNSEAHISLINIASLGNYRFLLATFISLKSSLEMPFKQWNIKILEGNHVISSEMSLTVSQYFQNRALLRVEG